MQPSRASIVLATASVWLIWGSTYLAIRYAIETLPPLLMSAARFGVAGLVLYAVLRARGEPAPTVPEWRSTALIGALLLMCGNGAVSWSEQWVPSGLVALTVAIVPAWMVLIDWLAGGPRPTLPLATGLGLGFVGVGILISPGDLLGSSDLPLLPTLAVVGGTIAWAIGSIYSRHATLPASPLMSTAAQMLWGGLWLAVAGILIGEGSRIDPAGVTAISVLAWVYLVVFGAIIAFSAYVYLLRHTEPARASTYAYVNPLIAVGLGWSVAGEPLDSRVWLALAAIVPAVALIVTFRRRVPRPRQPPA